MIRSFHFLTNLFRPRTSVRETILIKGMPLQFVGLDGDTGDQIRENFEAEVYDYIVRLPKASVFYDLGASIGNFSLFAAACGLDVYGFEPDKGNFDALKRNKHANRLSNLAIFRLAISDGLSQSGTLLSNSLKQRAGDHQKVLSGAQYSGPFDVNQFESRLWMDHKQTVKVLSLDQLVEQKLLPPPNYMKIDIDGSEVAFLKGASKTLINPELKGFIIELYKESHFYPGIIRTLNDAGFRSVAQHQIRSSSGLERNLYNMEFERS